MERRYFLFIALSFAFMLAYSAIAQRLLPPPAKPKPADRVAKADPLSTGTPAPSATGEVGTTPEGSGAATGAATAESTAAPAGTGEVGPGTRTADPAIMAEAPVENPLAFHTLGSLDPSSGYTMLVHLTSEGAAVRRVELSDGRYLELEDPADAKRDPPAYLGHLELQLEKNRGEGAEVRVVGAGSPAAQAGVKVGDKIKTVDHTRVVDGFTLSSVLRRHKPDDVVEILLDRGGKEERLSATLRRCPLQLVKPEAEATDSLLLTLQTLDDYKIEGSAAEMRGLRMRATNWELMPGATGDSAVFRLVLPRLGLEFYKKYKLAPSNKQLAPAPAEGLAAAGDPGVGYGLVLEVEVRNVGATPRTVAYRLDGLQNLPTEGYWFAYKLGGYGTRDVAVRSGRNDTEIYPSRDLNTLERDGKTWLDRAGEEVIYAGVDTQYFAGILIPLKARREDVWFQYVRAVRSGPVQQNPYLLNCNVQFVSQPWNLAANGGSASHRYLVFAGPKAPDKVLAPYDRLYSDGDLKLDWLMKYGWFPYLVLPLTWYLEFLFAIIGNYGIAIILLTMTVRLILFPFTRRQALQSMEMSEKMARIKPEQDRIMDKYKNDPVAKQRALQELWAKNDVNPLGMLPGCLGALLQLPVFIGLYNALRTDVELRQSSLFGENLLWCSNLAAPDMLWYWEHSVPSWVTDWPLNLGPYFNLLPVISTILLYFQQRRMLAQMPGQQTPEQRKKEDELRAAGKLPALTMEQEQQRMLQDQQKTMMTTMTFVGAILFFRFPAGLALYFITSTIWGVIERESLPKKKPSGTNGAAIPVAADKPATGGLMAALAGGGSVPAERDQRAEAERKQQRRKKQGKR